MRETLLFVFLMLLPSTGFASFCEDGSEQGENSVIICGSGESPVRPEAEAFSRHSVMTEFQFTAGNSRRTYKVIPRRLSCEIVSSDLYGTGQYWRCVRSVEYVFEN